MESRRDLPVPVCLGTPRPATPPQVSLASAVPWGRMGGARHPATPGQKGQQALSPTVPSTSGSSLCVRAPLHGRTGSSRWGDAGDSPSWTLRWVDLPEEALRWKDPAALEGDNQQCGVDSVPPGARPAGSPAHFLPAPQHVGQCPGAKSLASGPLWSICSLTRSGLATECALFSPITFASVE